MKHRALLISVGVGLCVTSAPVVAEAAEVVPLEAAPAVTAVSQTAEPFFKPKVAGFIDGFVQHTFGSTGPSMRVFDGSSDAFDVALAQVDLQAEIGRLVLVRLELIAGSSTSVLNGTTVPEHTDPISGTILRSIQQANIGVKLP